MPEVFAVSLLPQFVSMQGVVLASSIAFAAYGAAVSGAWFCGFVWAHRQGSRSGNQTGSRHSMHALTGVTLMCLGVAVEVGARRPVSRNRSR